MLSKKSVSPLIATILLIVVSVILITVVLTWGKGFTESTIKNTDLFTSFNEDLDLKGFIVVNSLTQSESNNTLILKNTSKFDLNVIGYSLLSSDSNYVFLNKYFYLETPLFLSSGSITSLSLVCIPSNKFSIQLITDQNTFVEVLFFTNNLNQDAYCLGRDDLVGYWSFDENNGSVAYDYSGNSYNGLVDGALYVPGKINSALYFNGESSCVRLGNKLTNSKLQMGDGSVTVENWINVPDWGGKTRQIFYGSSGGGGRGYGVLLQTNGIDFRSEIYGEINSRQHTVKDIGIINNQWNHVVSVLDGVNHKVTFYLNGEEKHVANILDPGFVETQYTFIIGAHYNCDVYYFLGAIDNLRIYNRSLTEEEVKILYRQR